MKQKRKTRVPVKKKKIKNTAMSHRVPLILFLLLLVLSIWSFISPHDMQVWWTEMASVFLLVGALAATYKRFRFSNTAYLCMWLWCAMQIIGAHYTFEYVPFDAVTRLFGFERNHYDRVAHFVVGLGSIAIAELLWKRRMVNGLGTAAWFSVVFMLAIAGIWELVEWIYAEVDGGDAGQAFLGAQGDIWDAQKDMMLDTMGAILAAVLFYMRNRKSPAPFAPGEIP